MNKFAETSELNRIIDDGGYVKGPSSSTDNALARFDGTGGTIQDSNIIIDDVDRMTVVGSITGKAGETFGVQAQDGAGNDLDLTGGIGSATGSGGVAFLQGGAGGATSGDGGPAKVHSGKPNDGAGGDVEITAQDGAGTNKDGGDVVVTAGNKTGSGTDGKITLGGDVFVANAKGVVVGHTAKIDFGAVSEFQVLGTTTPDSSMGFGRFQNNASGPDVRFLKSRSGTIGVNTIVQDGDTLGRLRFQGADGIDFNTTAAEVLARVDGTPGGNDIPGRIVFRTRIAGGSLADRVVIKNDGKVGMGVASPAEQLHVDDAIALSNNAEGSTARLVRRTSHETHTLAAASTSDTTTISIPSGARLLAVSMNVNVVVADGFSGDWSAAFITGSTTSITSSSGGSLNTKVDFIVPDDEKTTAVTQIRFTAGSGNFSAGVIEIVAYYEQLTSLADV